MSKRIRDVVKSQYPPKIKYLPGEPGSQRHQRRLDFAIGLIPLVKRWAAQEGIELVILNQNNHWIWRKGKQRADWWPSSAKLVLNQDFDNGIHAHDPGQVARELVDRWRIER